MKMREAGVGSPGMGVGNPRLQAKHPQSNQGVCADAVAAMEGIGREELERLGVESQRRAARAIAEGRFDKSTIVVRDDEGNVILDHEEYPRPDTTLESLAELKPAFEMFYNLPSEKDGPTFAELIKKKYPDLDFAPLHHVGISSGVVDGAAAVLLASPDYAEKHGLKPRARIVAMANVGDDPTLMLNAPVPAAKKVLAKAGLSKDDIDVWEVNEAFAVVAMAPMKELGIPHDKLNVNGGACALGHPIGASGARLVVTLIHALKARGGKRGVASLCIGGGEATAIAIELL
jgi:acetyl-CoA C-acetyltransferase